MNSNMNDSISNADDLRVVEGFLFPTTTEAQTALKEKKNIEIIKQRTPLNDPKAAYSLYCKLIERNMFKTEVGYSFLHDMREYLVEDLGFDNADVPTIDIPKAGSSDIFSDIKREKQVEEIEQLKLSKKRMTIVILSLIIIIGAMFVIAIINPNVGYVNTERKVLNKYAAWEEDLSRREEEVKQKEKDLGINPSE